MIWDLLAVRGMYWVKCDSCGGRSLLPSSWPLLEPGLSLSFLADTASARTWFWYSSNSFIGMYLVTLICNSSRLDAGFLHKLLTKGIDCNIIIKWCIATTEFKFWIFTTTFLKRYMKVHNGSFFSCRMLTRATNVRWWGWLVENYVPKRATKVSNKSMEFGGSCVNQWRACPSTTLGILGKGWHWSWCTGSPG